MSRQYRFDSDFALNIAAQPIPAGQHLLCVPLGLCELFVFDVDCIGVAAGLLGEEVVLALFLMRKLRSKSDPAVVADCDLRLAVTDVFPNQRVAI